MTNEEYRKFMYDPQNVMACDKCPENLDMSPWPGFRKPCGQFHCWVSLHLDRLNSDEEEEL